MREAMQIGLQGTRARVVLSGGGQWSVANGALEFCDECAVAELGWALVEMGSGKWCLYTVRSGTIIELHQRDTWSFDHDSGGIMINWTTNRADGGLAVFRSYRAAFRRAVLYVCANRTGEGLAAGDFLSKLYRLVAGDLADPSWISTLSRHNQEGLFDVMALALERKEDSSLPLIARAVSGLVALEGADGLPNDLAALVATGGVVGLSASRVAQALGAIVETLRLGLPHWELPGDSIVLQ